MNDAHRPEPAPSDQLATQEATPAFDPLGPTLVIADAAGPPAAGPSSVPGYEVLGELGRGGMGVVYKARQVSAGRVVALKMILAGGHAGPDQLQRFRAEAEAVARLKHPNIVQVHEVGEHAGLPFFSLEYCEGGTLAARLAGTPLPPRQAAELLEPLARAVDAAHRKGVVHRDLKPANVLLAEDGTPKITDFGLAKTLDADAGHTRTGAVLGTPPYMAPEQAAGKTKEIGPGTDVYGLGAVLYECLTGRPPFKAATPHETMRLVTGTEPAAVRSLNPLVPRDLETVCLKCLQKEPGRRYAGAGELADDLRRFLAGEPVRARPVGRLERGWKWARRRPAVAGLLAAVVLVAAGGLGGVLWAYGKALDNEREANNKAGQLEVALADVTAAERKAREESERAELKAKEAKEQEGRAELKAQEAKQAADALLIRKAELERALANGHVLLAQAAFDRNDVRLARELLGRVPEHERGWEWGYLKRHFTGGLFPIYGHGNQVEGVAFSPDGSLLATTSSDKTARLWDARTGEPRLELRGHAGGVLGVAFSPDSALVATASADRTARVWDARTGRELLTLRGHAEFVRGVAFSPDGSRLATCGGDYKRPGEVRFWDARTGAPGLQLAGHPGCVLKVAFSPDGSRLATAAEDGAARVYDARTGALLLVPELLQDPERFPLNGVAFSPDGSRLAGAVGNGFGCVWDARSGKLLLLLRGHSGMVGDVAFSPDGLWVATGAVDGVTRLFDAKTGQPRFELKGHTRVVRGVSFSPDGARLATASQDGSARVWDVRTGTPALRFDRQVRPFSLVAFSPDGSRFAAPAGDRKVRVWDARSGALLFRLDGHTDSVVGAAFSPDGSRLATASYDQTARVWDARTGAPLLVLRGHAAWVMGVAFSPDGSLVVTTSRDLTTRLWDAKTGERRLEFKELIPNAFRAVFSPDGSRVAASGGEPGKPGLARVWDADTGGLLLELKGHLGTVRAVCFSRDGSRIATSSWDKTARVWDARTGAQLLELKGHTGTVWEACFSPDGARLITLGQDQAVRVWDARTGTPLLELKVRGYNFYGVSISPDGWRLATPGVSVWLWDARPGPPTRLLPGTASPVGGVSFSPDGSRLRAADPNRAALVWDVATGRRLAGPGGDWPDGSAVSPDGRLAAWIDAEGAVRLIGLELDEAERAYRLLAAAPDADWHNEEAARTTFQEPFASAFHLGRLAALRPWDASLHARRAGLLAKVGRPDQAALAYTQAILADPTFDFRALNRPRPAKGQ